MYGYLRPDGRHGRTALSHQQCALCHAFARGYRQRTRLLAGYDPATLLLLVEALTDAAPARTQVRCPLPPFVRRRQATDPDWPAARAVAALQLFLAGEKLFDDRVDQDSLLTGAAERVLRRDVAAAEVILDQLARACAAESVDACFDEPDGERFDERMDNHFDKRLDNELDLPFDLAALRALLRSQAAIERDPGADLDALARPTRLALGRVACFAARVAGCDQAAVRAAGRFGADLGSAIYLVDALDDLPRDLGRGAFNPVTRLFEQLTPHAVGSLAAIWAGRLRSLADRFDALPLRRHRAPLRAATVASLDRRGRQALSRLPAPPATLRLAGVIA
ncbi:DUF5685 family protein [Haliangium sp.]|uniref:DUF5685 family protein n=1 Tax=Haliangium sp. TaxID=2663208 RepID=UPI003D136FEB